MPIKLILILIAKYIIIVRKYFILINYNKAEYMYYITGVTLSYIPSVK